MESGAYFYIIGKRARFFTTSRSEMEIIMGIAEIENSYAYQDAVWGRTRKTVEHDFDLDISSALEMTAEHNDAEVIGLTTIPYAHTNMSYGLKAQYAQESTDANPVVQVTSNYGGRWVSFKVHINEVDPENASQLEMFALCSHADAQGIGVSSGLGSFSKLKTFAANAELNGYISGMDGYEQFINVKIDWSDTISKIMEDYLNAGIYRQYQEGKNLLALFGHFDAAKQEADEDGQSSLKMTREELLQKIRDKIDEIYEKVKNGETEVSYQIGAQSFTEKEWDRLLKSFDSVEEELRKLVEEEIEQRKKADIESRKREEAQSEQAAENEAGILKAPDVAETEEYIRSFSRLHILK